MSPPQRDQDWEALGIVVEGNPIIVGGLNPWAFDWRQVQEEPVELPNPAYPNQRHHMWVYEIQSDGNRVRFVAAEVAANTWAFYVPAG